jgi:hypothetical protein
MHFLPAIFTGTYFTDSTAELACAIANRCGATGARQSLRAYGADYKTVLRQAQPQVRNFHFSVSFLLLTKTYFGLEICMKSSTTLNCSHHPNRISSKGSELIGLCNTEKSLPRSSGRLAQSTDE